jgi:ribosome-binding protein aMBF1 (putative translation factor)
MDKTLTVDQRGWGSTGSRARSPPKISARATMSDVPRTPEQMKAARELLGWSQTTNRVGLSEWVIRFYERGERLIRARYPRRVSSIFEIFVEENGEERGVRLRKAAK